MNLTINFICQSLKTCLSTRFSGHRDYDAPPSSGFQQVDDLRGSCAPGACKQIINQLHKRKVGRKTESPVLSPFVPYGCGLAIRSIPPNEWSTAHNIVMLQSLPAGYAISRTRLYIELFVVAINLLHISVLVPHKALPLYRLEYTEAAGLYPPA